MSEEASVLPLPLPTDAGKTPDVSAIVYVDKHLENVAQMYGYLANILHEMGLSFEFIFVDDGNAKRIFFEMEGFHKFVRDAKIIRLPRQYGPTTAMSAGFRHAKGKLILTLGPFLQVHPQEIHKMFKKIGEGYDFVNGWRVNRKDTWLNRAHTKTYNWLLRRISDVDLHDTNCTLKLFKRELVDEVPVYGDLYRFFPILAARHGYLVTEVPVNQRTELNRVGVYAGRTYIARALDLVVLLFISRFTQTPLRFFGTLGAAFTLAGLAINFYLVYLKFSAGEVLAERPLLHLGVLLMVLGVQLGSVGLIAELILFSGAKNIRRHHIERILQ